MFWALRSHPDIWRNGNAASWILWFGALTFYPPCALSHFIPWKPLTRVPCTSVCSCVLWLELVCECVFWFSTNGLYIAHFCVLFRIAQFWSWLPYSPFIWEEGEFTPLCLSKGRNAALWTSVASVPRSDSRRRTDSAGSLAVWCGWQLSVIFCSVQNSSQGAESIVFASKSSCTKSEISSHSNLKKHWIFKPHLKSALLYHCSVNCSLTLGKHKDIRPRTVILPINALM